MWDKGHDKQHREAPHGVTINSVRLLTVAWVLSSRLWSTRDCDNLIQLLDSYRCFPILIIDGVTEIKPTTFIGGVEAASSPTSLPLAHVATHLLSTLTFWIAMWTSPKRPTLGSVFRRL